MRNKIAHIKNEQSKYCFINIETQKNHQNLNNYHKVCFLKLYDNILPNLLRLHKKIVHNIEKIRFSFNCKVKLGQLICD